MTKRSAESPEHEHEVPRKRCARGTVPPPATRCRKRPNCPEPTEPPEPPEPPEPVRDSPPHSRASGTFRPAGSANKRAREESAPAPNKAARGLTTKQDDVGEEDLSAFNSFQFWRPPLPELDLTLLDDQATNDVKENSSKDSSEAMET